MAAHGVKILIYLSTCATYGEPEKMPINEESTQLPINVYGKDKTMAEDMILDLHKTSDLFVMILRFKSLRSNLPCISVTLLLVSKWDHRDGTPLCSLGWIYSV